MLPKKHLQRNSNEQIRGPQPTLRIRKLDPWEDTSLEIPINLFKEDKRRLYRPWKDIVILKLFGKK